jgi:Tol biopolymer transport system component
LKSDEDNTPTSWSGDGRFLLYTVRNPNPKSHGEIWVLPLEGGKKPVPFLITEFDEISARFSPDGHWVAYASNESGQSEVYVRSFSINSAGTAVEAGGKWQISNGIGEQPHWRGDGRELYYRSPTDGNVMAVEIATNPSFRHGVPKTLGVTTTRSLGTFAWDAAPDGERFLKLAFKNGPAPFTFVLNWQGALKK